ncbi:MAG: hydrogenase iron-sulfur subunit [Caldimicrobium sp.]|nr:hydrogenase iron-sulfur subunit [Caldimicrobium sp.]MCX7612843.1 hydrogenase iron-sulfur subunit [Caldimicrobium sp.]MDW8183285.1 hydrogenase iron-sulfur subunit [Caldimicrobium sp.]
MENSFKIAILCCNYTNLAEREDLADIVARIEVKRYPCSGKIEITDILRAFREGAKGVMVAGCARGTCHNLRGSDRAERRVVGARATLKELEIEPERVEMFFVSRLDAGDFAEKAKEFYRRILKLELKERTQ